MRERRSKKQQGDNYNKSLLRKKTNERSYGKKQDNVFLCWPFLNYIVLMLSSYSDPMYLFLPGKHLPCPVCSKSWTSRLDVFDVASLLYLECRVYEFYIKPSIIVNSQAGTDCFANQSFKKKRRNWVRLRYAGVWIYGEFAQCPWYSGWRHDGSYS